MPRFKANMFRGLYYLNYQIDKRVAGGVDMQQTLLISGFWRSGTTWLQQSAAGLLGAKTIFEPLDPLVPGVINLYREISGLPENPGPNYFRTFMPYCAPDQREGALLNFIRQALAGNVRGRWVRHLRIRPDAALNRRVVAKIVCGHLSLRAIQNACAVPVIHLYRDPRAIAASVKLLVWREMFEPLSLTAQLLQPADGRAAFFDQWRAEITSFDREPMLIRLIAYWALLERHVLATYADRPPRACLIGYEAMVRRPAALLQWLEQLQLTPRSQNLAVFDQDSRSTSAVRAGISLDQRLFGWQDRLTAAEIQAIEAVARQFGLDERLVNA